MQKQYSPSPSSHDHHSISSRSVRKLYHRIQNNNIRHLNKSKISTNSNRSIGSLALRRTQLSNDKIYSREQDTLHNNTSQTGLSFQTAFDQQSDKQTIPIVPIMSNQNSRPRPNEQSSRRSLKSDLRKQTRHRQNPRKYDKNEIQKLLMLEPNINFINGTQNKKRQNQPYSRSHSKKQKQYIQCLRPQDKSLESQNESKIKQIRSVKSSDKSDIKIKPYVIKKQPLPSQKNNELQRLAKKYKNIGNGQPIKSSKQLGAFNERIDQMYIGEARIKNAKYKNQVQKENSKNLQKYKSEKDLTTDDKILDTVRKYEKGEDSKDSYQMEIEKYKRQKMYQNSLEKYQKQTWTRNFNRKYAKQGNQERNNYDHQAKPMNRPMYGYPSPYMISKKIFQKQKNQRQIDPRGKDLNEESRGRHVKFKNQKSRISNIRIKQHEYGNFIDTHQEQHMPNNQRQSHSRARKQQKSPSYKSPNHKYHKQKHQPDHDYYHYVQGYKKRPYPKIKTPDTRISSTFDSLILSINSHISQEIGGSLNTNAIIDKINLHLKTLDLISDYALEFKKMYEKIDDWEELIFLAYKKYWIQKTKVLEYLRKFRKSKRHQSQRMIPQGSRKIHENKVSSIKNLKSQGLRVSNSDDPFSDQNLIMNPFFIPFCKVNENESKKIALSEEGGILLQKIEKQVYQSYQKLQQMYNLIISKSGDRINMLYCDNFSDDMFIMMLDEIEQLIPNLQEFKVFEATKIRLGKIVKSGILILFMNGKVIRNIAEIITFDDCQKIGTKRKIKTFTTYDLYYEVFEKLVAQ